MMFLKITGAYEIFHLTNERTINSMKLYLSILPLGLVYHSARPVPYVRPGVTAKCGSELLGLAPSIRLA